MKRCFLLMVLFTLVGFLSANKEDLWVFDLKPSEFEKTQKLAEEGDLDAQHRLGVMYARGVGTEVNGDLSDFWYKKAALRGHAASQYLVGMIEKDKKNAIEWFLKSANQGYLKAQYYLGSGLTRRFSPYPRDYDLGVKFLTKAAEQNHLLACLELADFYTDYPRNQYPDYKKAFFYYKKAAKLGSNTCQFEVGSMYIEGSGVVADFVQAYSWLSVAKANGNQMASKRIDSLIPRMTNEQIAIGQVLAGELFEEIAKGIEESPVHTKFD